MKKFFYFLPLVALLLVGCKPPVNPPAETPIFTLKYYDANGTLHALTNGQTLELSKFDEGANADKLLFDGKIYCEETFNLEVTATRKSFEGTSDEFCVDPNVCIPGQPVAVQNFNFNNISLEETRFYAHFDAENQGNYQIVYDFHEKEKPNVKISVTVIYKYHLN